MTDRRSGWPQEIQGTSDPSVAGASAPTGWTYRRLDTGALYQKTGGGDTDWTILSFTSNRQTFRVARQVGDTDTITIDASRGFLARANTNYNVMATMGANSLAVGIQSIDPASFTTTQFVLVLTSAWAAGDSIMFTVEDLT